MPAGGNVIQLNMPITGMFTPGLPRTTNGRPYIDYTLNVTAPGTYTISLISSNPQAYDPYLYLLQNGVEIASDDDSGGNLNSQLTRMLTPGVYVVRVSSFRPSITQVVPFTLTVIRQ